MQNVSVNQMVKPLVQELVDKSDALRVGVGKFDNGARYIDAGIDSIGGLEAGRIIGEICMGGDIIMQTRGILNDHQRGRRGW